MRQIIASALFALALLVAVPVKAQENTSPFRNMFVEFGVGYACYEKREHTNIFKDKINDKKDAAVLTPIIGYRFHPRWAVGFGVALPVGENRLYKPMPSLFVSYDFLRFGDFSVFSQLQGSYGKDRYQYDGGNPKHMDMWEAGVRFGASYKINEHFSAQLRYLFIGYSRRASNDTYRGGVVGDHNFIMDAGLRPLQLSLRYTF